MWPTRPKKISFEDARKVLVAVLNDVRCDWAEKIALVSPPSFPSLLGGMGSFSDLVICRENHHEITSDREPLANELVHCLTEICYAFSKGRRMTAEVAVASCGSEGLILTGWRCRACGYAQTTSRAIRSLMAAVQVQKTIREGIERGAPADALLALWRAREDPQVLQVLIQRAQASGIDYTGNDAFMRPCTKCGSDDTCVYRWNEDRQIFVPTEDNLPLRKAGA